MGYVMDDQGHGGKLVRGAYGGAPALPRLSPKE